MQFYTPSIGFEAVKSKKGITIFAMPLYLGIVEKIIFYS